MKTILLYGILGKKFGKSHSLDVKNPAEAIRALCVLFKGFKQHIVNDKDSGYEIFIGSEDIYVSNMHNPTSNKEVIRIVPIISGSGNEAKIVLGVILIAVAYAYGGAAGGVAAEATLLSWGTVAQVGVLLVVQGIAGIILESSIEENELADDNPNYAFDGVINTTRQGIPVAVGYGTLRIGSQVISAGLTTE